MKFSAAIFAAALALVFTSSPAFAFWPFDGKKPDDSTTQAPAVSDTKSAAPDMAITIPDKKPVATDTAKPAVKDSSSAAPSVTAPTKPTAPSEPAKPTVAPVTAPAAAVSKDATPAAAPVDKEAAAKTAAKAKADAEKATEKAKADAEKAKQEEAKAKEAADKAKAEEDKKAEELKKKDAATIQGHLEGKGEFKTLLDLLKTAGITTLKSPGNYTIFAPTDAAFAKFSGLKIENLKKPEGMDTLKSLLGYHMLNGNFLLKNIAGRIGAPNALQGEEIHIDATTEPAHIGKATITGSDTGSTNGTIYVLDEVLMPPSMVPAKK